MPARSSRSSPITRPTAPASTGSRAPAAAVKALPAIDDAQPRAVEPAPVVVPAPVAAPAVVAAPAARAIRRQAEPRARATTKPVSSKLGVRARTAPTQRAPESPARTQLARLTLASSPPGATFVVNGEALGRGTTQTTVPALSKVKITAVLRGHKRATYTVRVGRNTSVVIPMERLGFH